MPSKLKNYIQNKLMKLLPPRMARTLFVPVKQAGVVVTCDTAMTYSAIWRSVNLIAQSIAALPWSVNSRNIKTDGSKETKPLYSDPLYTLLDVAPNDEVDAFTFRETLIAYALTRGNGYAEIERNGAGVPVALWFIESERVRPDRDDQGRLGYVVLNYASGEDVWIPAQDMFHLKGLGFDGMTGYSVIAMAARAIGLGIATEEFGSSFFENGAHIGGVLEHPGALGDDAYDHLKKSLSDKKLGADANSPLILEEGMKWTSIGVPPDDAQFLETRKFQVSEIARWFGVPLHKLNEMDSSTFSNIEHQAIEFVTDTLTAWVKRLETEANMKLVPKSKRGKVFTKININGLLRGDMKTRAAFYKSMMNLGVFSINEVRDLEDKNGIGTDGDKRLVQLNQTTLEKIGEDVVDVPRGTSNESSAEQRVLEEALDRILSRENHRAEAALKKFRNDKKGLSKWIVDFYDEHAEYAKAQLVNVFDVAGVEISVDDYVSEHVEASMTALAVYVDQNQKGVPIARTGDEISEQLLGDNHV